MSSTRTFAPEVKQLLQRIKARVHEEDPTALVYLFGSRARGDAGSDSDWDIFVLTDHHRPLALLRPLSDRLFDIMFAEDIFIQILVYSKAVWLSGASPNPIYDAVRREGILL